MFFDLKIAVLIFGSKDISIFNMIGDLVMKYLLGIDFGGGASKATLLGTDGKIYADNTVEYPTLRPQNSWCEQSPSDWMNALYENIAALLSKSGIAPSDILTVAIDSATHTFLPTDENGIPLRNAIHWTDSRSTKEAAYLRENHLDMILAKTYHKPDTIWTLPMLLWMRDNEPEIFAKTKRIYFEKDYIRFMLTGVWCTDYIEAEGSMLYDLDKSEWSKELCDLCGLDIACLPPLVKPTDVIGNITKEAAEKCGLCEGTPVICGTTDTVMEVFASGAVSEGDMTVKLATAGRICVITSKAYPHTHLINYSHIADGLWYPGTATKACAQSYRWYRDTFGGDYKELDSGAAALPIGSEGVMFHPYINGELTPYADPTLCGSFIGVRANHTKAHFTRAVLEGVCFSLLDCMDTLTEIGIPHKETAVIIGGGAKSPLWRQMTADMLGITLYTTESSDSSLGSAMLAGIAAGVFASPEDAVKKCIVKANITEPIAENTAKYREVFKKYKAVQRALAPIYHGEF